MSSGPNRNIITYKYQKVHVSPLCFHASRYKYIVENSHISYKIHQADQIEPTSGPVLARWLCVWHPWCKDWFRSQLIVIVNVSFCLSLRPCDVPLRTRSQFSSIFLFLVMLPAFPKQMWVECPEGTLSLQMTASTLAGEGPRSNRIVSQPAGFFFSGSTITHICWMLNLRVKMV